jgi:purine-nucleoside phosphorylase
MNYDTVLLDVVEAVKEKFNISASVKTGLILGTGWGDSLKLKNKKEVSLVDLFNCSLREVKGHARKLEFGQCSGKDILVLRGRVHLNEALAGDHIPMLVRIQIELMMKLGVKNLIVTAGVGSLEPHIMVGHVVVVDSFVTLFAPPMPLWGGEFCSPEDALAVEPRIMAMNVARDMDLIPHFGSYAMIRGPFFEGRRHDKSTLRNAGGSVVGMSMLPEACIADLYGVKILGLGFVTNTHVERHSHEDNLRRARESSEKLSNYLEKIIGSIA